MNKKVMALAVAGALAAPAAALAQVEIGGSIHLQYYSHDSGSQNSMTTDVLSTSEPEIYIRGEEKLGGGMSTWFQCTSSFDVIGTGAQTANAGQWCGRNSAIGFKGGFGNAFAGTWDTPHKLVSNQARGWWGGTNTLQGGTQVLLGQGAQSNASNNGISFFRRESRTINYYSPNWGGFTLNAAFSASNESTALSDASPLKPRLFSLSGIYQAGPFFAGIGYEQHKDYNPGGAGGFGTTAAGYTGGTDHSYNVSVGYTIAGQARLSALYMHNEWENGGNIGAGAGNTNAKLKTDGYALYVDWAISGPHKLYAQYGNVGDVKLDSAPTLSGSATGGKVVGAAYGYKFSKRTEGYVGYNQMKNDSNANYSFGTLAASATSSGSKQTVFGIGLKHSF